MIGAMRDRVVIKQPIDVPVEGGGAESIYTQILSDWAEVKTVNNTRNFTDNQINLDESLLFILRWRTSIQPDKTMLIEYNGNDYTINSIKEYHNNKRKRFWQIVGITTEQATQLTLVS